MCGEGCHAPQRNDSQKNIGSASREKYFLMTIIYLVRHGEYENPKYTFPGRSPEGFPLSERGRGQVNRLASYFSGKPIAALYSSPILRCKQSAEILSERVHLPIVFDDRLLEVRTMADGVPMRLFDADPVRSYRPELLIKGAESMTELTDRMVAFMEEKRKKHNTQAG